ncbi:MAG: DUF4832 domain-containing protein, partial [Bacteroidales bacterium]|nr:DUF4832 domain-containing protein [Bacteroidales bacterium]
MPADRFVAMRYIEHHKIAFWQNPLTQSQAYNGSTQARIGTHHDRLMYESNWVAPNCGSCPPYAEMKSYAMQDTKWALYEGEPESSSSNYYQSDPRIDFSGVHITAMANNANGNTHYDYWKAQGWYNDLTRDLGYRIRLNNATIANVATAGETFPLQLNIDNIGYSSPVNNRKVEIVLRNVSNGNEQVIDITSLKAPDTDPRYWLPGSFQLNLNVPVPAGLPAGSYEMFLNLPDPETNLHGNPAYSIRLANTGLWESATGFNSLKHTINITAASTDCRNADNPSGTAAGLNYEYFKGSWNNLPDFNALTPAASGKVNTFDLNNRDQDDNFAFRFSGYINIATNGSYTFYTSSDDGSKLYIGNTEVVNNDGLHATTEKSGTICLKPGKHAIRVTFFEKTGGQSLTVMYAGPGISKTNIPASALSSSSGITATNTVVVRARGVAGSEQIAIELNNAQVQTWTLSKTYANYSYTGSVADKNVKIRFINDQSGRDVELDNIIIDETTLQAENQATNTSVWQNGSCGGSYSQWMHCPGYIDFGTPLSSTPAIPEPPSSLTATAAGTGQINLSWTDKASNETGFKVERKSGTNSFSQIATVTTNTYGNSGLTAGTTYTYRVRAYNAAGNSAYSNEVSATTEPLTSNLAVRARGVSGSEIIALRINDVQIKTWSLSTTFANYSYQGNLANNNVKIAYINDQDGWDVEVDYLQVDGITFQAEDQATNTSVWQGGSCGGSYAQWMHCPGYIDFGTTVSKSAQSVMANNAINLASVGIFPNPSANGQVNIKIEGIEEAINFSVVSADGKTVHQQQLHGNVNGLQLPKGLYFAVFKTTNQV